MTKYKSTIITDKKANELRKLETWDEICENLHGIAYWNPKTGELMWVSYDEDDQVQYEQLLN